MRPFDDVRVVRLRRVAGAAGDQTIAVRVFPRRLKDGSVDRDVPAVWRRRCAPVAATR